jgi:S1-C subfamily serine protease
MGGDIITFFDNEKVAHTKHLQELIAKHKPGDEVVIKVLREEEEIEIKAKLGFIIEDDDEVENMIKEAMRVKVEAESLSSEFNKNPEFEIPDDVKIRFGILPYLGVHVEPYNGDVKGIIIVRVAKNSSASKQGLKNGYIIVEIGGKQVVSSDELQNTIKQHKIGEDIVLRVIVEEGKLEERKIKLGVFPEPNFRTHNKNLDTPQQRQYRKDK